MKTEGGFTLIELMIVVAIIAILATTAIPTYQDRVIRSQIEEALALAESAKLSIRERYQRSNQFPSDNAAADLPSPDFLIGNFVTGIVVDDGAIHITLGNRINAHATGKVLTLRPATVVDSPNSPISWLCGYAEPVDGMEAVGLNQTSVPAKYLPMPCRLW